jgi:hypothetical protein
MYALILGFLLLLPPLASANYTFDGANDSIKSADNAVTEIGVGTFSTFVCVKVTAQPAGPKIIFNEGPTGGNTLYAALVAVAPASSGWRFQYYQDTASATPGEWRYDTDLSLDTWYKIGIDWDSNAATYPVIRVNGSTVSTTELTTPVGIYNSIVDTLWFGELLNDGSLDFQGKIEQWAKWSARHSAGDWTSVNATGPSAVSTARLSYLPFLTDAVDTDGATGAMTVTGATLDSADNCFSTTRRKQAPIPLD